MAASHQTTIIGMTLEDVLRRMPKVELHCHLIGTVRPRTWAELAQKHDVPVPPPGDAEFIYTHINSRNSVPEMYQNARIPFPPPDPGWDTEPSFSLLAISLDLARCIVDPTDFERIAYEALEDGVRTSHVRYREMFFEPSAFMANGVSYRSIVDGLIAGLRAAEHDFGIRARLIGGINREESGSDALHIVEQMVASPREEVVGIGLDNFEIAGPPQKFANAYDLAERNGLHRTAHAAEHDPSARNITTCLDVLHCDRLDHGYFVMEDEDVVERCRTEQVPFTCIFTTSRRAWRPWRRASIKAMVERGLKVSLSSDDPAMFPTTLADEYVIAATQVGFDWPTLRQLNLNGVDAAWLNASDKARLRAELASEMDALAAELAASDGAR
ncbi:MAG: adenosine deaminase [Chloroflexota bacterium]